MPTTRHHDHQTSKRNLVDSLPLALLPVFLSVAQTASFTRSAEYLGLPVASVSRKISKLEHLLGAVLFKRNTRQVTLTDAGAEFYERLVPAMGRIQDAMSGLSEANKQLRGHIRLTTPADFAGRYLAPQLTQFLSAHPLIHVELNLSAHLMDLVKEHIDIAIRIGHLHDSGLFARTLFHNRLKLFAAPSLLAGGPVIETPYDLTQYNILHLKQTHAQGKLKLHQLQQEVTVHTHSNLQMNDMNAMIHFCEAGAGIALLPTMFVTKHVAQNRLIPVLSDWYSDTIPVHAVTTARNPPARVRALVDFLMLNAPTEL